MLLLSVEKLAADEAANIRQARANQNRAMCAQDTELAASYWTDDVTLRRGLGSSVIGKEAYRALLDKEQLFYVREPEFVEISPDWPLAYESGRWTAHYEGVDGPIAISGRYSAQWVKREEEWLIRSEVFVALSCHDSENSWTAMP